MSWAGLWYLIGAGGTPTPTEPSSGSALPQNATLIFQVPVADESEGDRGVNEVVTRPLIVRCYLKRHPRTETQLRQRGDLDDSEIYLKGYALIPDALPPEIKPGAQAEATIGKLQGTFFLEPDPQSPFELVTKLLGERVEGILRTTIEWSDAL